MKHTKKIISAILLSGMLIGCTPADKNTKASNSTGTSQTTSTEADEDALGNAGTTTPGETTQDSMITQAIDPDIILAEGDGILITTADVEKEYNKMLDSLRAEYSPEMVASAIGTLQNEKANILEQYLRNELLSKKGEELGIELEDEEAVAKYEQVLKENITNFGGQVKFDEVLKQAGYTAESYREDVLNSLLYEAVAEEVTKDITVDEAEITKEYDEVKDVTYTEQPSATLYHIFFGNPEEVKDAEAKAKEAKQKLDDGTPFAQLAKDYGQDGTAEKEGLLGDFPYENKQLAPDFMNEAYKLEEGEVSEPVKTTFGWHLIKAENVQKETKVHGLTDKITLENGQEVLVSENIRMNILNGKRKVRLDELFAQWETKWNVKKYKEDAQLPIAAIDIENIQKFLDRYIEDEGWSLSYSLDRNQAIVYGSFNNNNFREIVDEAYADIQGRNFFNQNTLKEIREMSQAINTNFPNYEFWILDPLTGDWTGSVDKEVVKLKGSEVLYNKFDSSFDMDEEKYITKWLDRLCTFDGLETEYNLHYDDNLVVFTPTSDQLSNLVTKILNNGWYNKSDKSSWDYHSSMYGYISGEIMRLKPNFKIEVVNPNTIMNSFSEDQMLLVFENRGCTFNRFP